MTSYNAARKRILWQGLLVLAILFLMLYPLFGSFTLVRDTLSSANAEKKINDVSFSEAKHTTPEPWDEPIISLAFDDSWLSVYTNAIPVLEERNLKSTQYILTDTGDDPSYMKHELIKRLNENGHQIASHTVTHARLTEVGDDTLFDELAESKLAIRDRYGLTEDLAYPYGAYNKRVNAEAQKYYRSLRTVDQGVNTEANFNRLSILSYTIERDTALEDVIDIIESARDTNGWVIFNFHSFEQVEDSQYDLSIAEFTDYIDAFDASGIEIYTVGQVLDVLGI